MDEVAKFGEKLKQYREKAGLTQLEVAKAMGYTSAQFISNWERGLATPPLKTLNKLANLYKANIDDLFEAICDITLATTERSMREEFSRLKKKSGRR